MPRDLLETDENSLWGVPIKAPRTLEPRMSQMTNRKMIDNEYTPGNRLATIYNNIETEEQTVAPRDLTEASINSRWNIPRKPARNFDPQGSQVALRNRYQVLQNEDTSSNYRGNKSNELPMLQTEKSKVGDRIPREINPAPKEIPRHHR
eukprot:Seg4191.3 transcript_id=Seg4191.3/GoldUCD/mRNA.D3Y31 product="hypothetical protein" protein_id=Seg4191.3/GoldUCD/D3Y31